MNYLEFETYLFLEIICNLCLEKSDHILGSSHLNQSVGSVEYPGNERSQYSNLQERK